MKTNLELVEAIDNFPYYDPNHPAAFQRLWQTLWQFYLPAKTQPFGYITQSTVDRMPWTSKFRLSQSERSVHIVLPSDTPDQGTACTAAIAEVLDRAKAQNAFPLNGMHLEQYGMLGVDYNVSIDRAGYSLFGVASRGVFMTAYTRFESGIKIWVPRRSQKVYTYRGMLDNSVAGGVAAGEMPFECLVREASEEASLPQDLVERETRACGTLTWMYIRETTSPEEKSTVSPGVQYVYDLELPADVQPRPSDDEVEEYYFWDVDTVKRAIAAGEFKPSCELVLFDFFIRHGYITAENEPQLTELVARMHRRLPFATTYLPKTTS